MFPNAQSEPSLPQFRPVPGRSRPWIPGRRAQHLPLLRRARGRHLRRAQRSAASQARSGASARRPAAMAVAVRGARLTPRGLSPPRSAAPARPAAKRCPGASASPSFPPGAQVRAGRPPRSAGDWRGQPRGGLRREGPAARS